jgi:hypothetical protein
MEIGKPRRVYTVEPIEHPVPQPEPAPEPDRKREEEPAEPVKR